MKTTTAILLTLALAVPLTWMVSRRLPSGGSATKSEAAKAGGAERRVLYFQSAMHPWIKSDKPGRCTICGMELTPVYEGDPGFDATGGGDVVPLSQSMIQVLNVQTAEAAVRPLRKTLTVAGRIDDNVTRHRVLSAYIPGRIQKLHVNYMGAEVREGQPLAEFYSPTLLQAEREYRTLSGELRVATGLRLLQMGLTAGQIESLEKKPGDTLTSQILAPIGGTVVGQSVYEGQYVQEGEPLFEIADFSTMWFLFNAYEQDLPWVKPGLNVDVTTPTHPGRVMRGAITFIDPSLEEATRSARVRVELDNPLVDGRRLLMHRIYADGVVHLDAPEVLTVPRSAVIQTGPEAVAYVEQGAGAYARRVLRLGRRGDSLVEVLDGIGPGEKVVVNGNLLIDGQAEMNRSFAVVSAAGSAVTDERAFPALTAEQRGAVQGVIAAADRLGGALAADDLGEFNLGVNTAKLTANAALGEFPAESPWRGLLEPLSATVPGGRADDLKAARRGFHAYSEAIVGLAQVLRRREQGFGSVKVYRCPMTKDAFPGAPNRAAWMQLQAPVRNPYFGAEMLDCGSEVK